MVDKTDVKKSALGLIRKIILGIAILALAFSAGWLVNDKIIQPYNYEKLRKETDITEAPTASGNEPVTTISNRDRFSGLISMNSDFVGKLYIKAIDDTGYNVVQTDNNSKYLNVGFKGESTKYGTLFVDYRNNMETLDSNTIIYGHNMRDGSQLGSLSLYSKIDNYKNFPTIQFDTLNGNYTWKVFAAFITNSEASQDNGYNFPYLTTVFPSDEKFLEFIEEVKKRSYYTNSSVDINANDKILTLSTCDTVFTGARFVLMARLVRNGESDSVDTSKATLNNNQRFPQAWYNAKGKSNPFKNTENFTLD